ncbi:MAG: DUF4350 domain-containing protein, partial [Pedobacter sp.]
MKGFKLYIISGSVLLVIYLIAQFNKPIPTNWSPSYLVKDKIPFGTFVLYNGLQEMIPGALVKQTRKSIYSNLKSVKHTGTAYIIIAPSLSADSREWNLLFKFAGQGNKVFIAAPQLGKYISKKLNISYNYNFSLLEDSTIQEFNFTNPKLRALVNY